MLRCPPLPQTAQADLTATNAALTALSTTVGTKAPQADLTTTNNTLAALSTTVGTKANASALAATDFSVADLTTVVNGKPSATDFLTLSSVVITKSYAAAYITANSDAQLNSLTSATTIVANAERFLSTSVLGLQCCGLPCKDDNGNG